MLNPWFCPGLLDQGVSHESENGLPKGPTVVFPHRPGPPSPRPAPMHPFNRGVS